MRFFSILFLVTVCGVGLGSALTWLSVQETRGFGAFKAGEWTAWPDAGSADADPYTNARIAVTGAVPMGAAEGIVFVAKRDAEGNPLQRTCDYRIAGRMPNARYWTLSAQDRNGRDIAAADGHIHPVISSQSVWDNGMVDIAVSHVLRGGADWLAISGTGPMQLSLALYDSQTAGPGTTGLTTLPPIRRLRCIP